MNSPAVDIAKEVERIQQDERLDAEFQERAAALEAFYQQMLAIGVARKENYNVIPAGEVTSLDASLLHHQTARHLCPRR